MVDYIALLGKALLFLLVFGMSSTCDVHHLLTQVRNVKALFVGMFCQFVVLPLLGFSAVRILGLDQATGITLIVVTSSPGGSYSNWWCSLFNADLALSVTMTAISTIMSVVALPVNLFIYTHFAYQADEVVQNLEFGSIFLALAVVISAVLLGILCSATIHSRKFNRIANHVGNLAGLTLVIFSLILASLDADSRIWTREWSFYVGVATPCVLSLIVANMLGIGFGLTGPERMTASIESCYQNVGIAMSLAMSMFAGDELSAAMGVPVMYGIVEAILVGLYCLVCWKKLGWSKSPSDAPFWKVITTSYEVLECEKKEFDVDEGKALDAKIDPDGDITTSYLQMGALCGACDPEIMDYSGRSNATRSGEV